MQWLNEPEKWREENSRISITAEPGTDMWREPVDGGIRSNGHYYYDTLVVDFTVSVKVSGDYSGLFDQAGIMIRTDDKNWMKCGIEYVHGIQHASVVMTRDWSDWSLLSLGNPDSVWFRVERKGPMLFVYYSVDGETYILMRKGYFSDALSIDVGVMAASPKGSGFTATFEEYEVRPL